MTMSTNNKLLISHPNSGKEVRYAPCVEEDIKALRKAERAGFYYPQLALKQLKSLASGPIGKANVFIPNINDSKAHTLQMYYMFLPGIRATIERRSNDVLTVVKLDISDGYNAIGRGGDKPGIYSVSRDSKDGTSAVRYKKNGRITSRDSRIVIIADSRYSTPDDAAEDILTRLETTAGRVAAQDGEFDLLYSPAGKSLGGMRNYDPSAITEGYAFAAVLANAMVHAKDKEKIHWISEYGGSAIFTQAMTLLAAQNVSFSGKKHSAYMYQPSTNPTDAIRLVHQLGFEVGKEFAQVRGARNSVSVLITRAVRAGNKQDEYSWQDYAGDLAKGGMNTNALVGAGVLALSLAPLSPAAAGVVAAAGTATGIVGAIHLGWTKVKGIFDGSGK